MAPGALPARPIRWRSPWPVAAALALALTLLLLTPPPGARLIGAGPTEASRAALATARQQAARATARARRLEAEARAAANAAASARTAEAAAAASVRAAEAAIAAAEARIGLVEDLRARQRARLAARQAPITRLTAVLQLMARRPPVLALVQPGSLADIAHVRALLATTLPAVEARTAALRAEVTRGTALRAEADAAIAQRRAARARLAEKRVALASLAARHRARAHALTDEAMREQDRAIALGAQARDIVDLMGKHEEQAALGRRLAALPAPLPRPAAAGAPAPGPAPDAPAFLLPVSGRLVTGFGEVSESGVRARGLTLLTTARARVVAPAAGRIVYAAPFHGYGRIVIIDHAAGWTTVLTGLASLAVRVGDPVARGRLIGRAAASRPTVTIELRHEGEPVDIAGLASG